MKKKCIITLICLINISNIYGSGFLSLKLGIDARSGAMGMAYTALQGRGTSSFCNPAALSFINGKYLAFTRQKWIQGVNNSFLGFDYGGDNGSWGIHTMFTEVGGIEQRTVASPEPESIFSFYEMVFGVSYSRKITETIGLGITVKGLIEKISIDKASGAAFDLGMQWQAIEKSLFLGAVIQNIGRTGKLYKERIDLPLTARCGAAYTTSIFGCSFIFAADGVIDDEFHLHSGIQFAFSDILFLRGGYQSGYEIKGLTAGLGVLFKTINFDYAYMDIRKGLGESHKLTCSIQL